MLHVSLHSGCTDFAAQSVVCKNSFSMSLLILVIVWGYKDIFGSGRHVYHSGSGDDNTHYVLCNMLKTAQLCELIM